MDRFLVYAHPAVPPMGILVDKSYPLDELQKKFSLEELKCFFKPLDFAWEDISAKK